jgi:hypothetical protein
MVGFYENWIMPLNSTRIKTQEINLKVQKRLKTKGHTCMQTSSEKLKN